MRKLRVGLIGCGNIAGVHLKYITREVPKENIALCDNNKFRLGYVSEGHDVRNTFCDIESMLKLFRPDIVHILTPPQSHMELGKECLKRDSNILIEKPFCLDVGEGEELLKLAQVKGLKVCVGHMRVFDPLVIRAAEVIESGVIGGLVDISITEIDNYLERKRAGLVPKWQIELPGEIFCDLLPHHLSVLNKFIRELEVCAVSWNANGRGEIAGLNLLLRSAAGTASVRMSVSSSLLRNVALFDCEKGYIVADFRNRLLTVVTKTGLPGAVERIAGNLDIARQLVTGTIKNVYRFALGRLDSYAGVGHLIESFYSSIDGERDIVPSGESGLLVVKQMEGILRDISAGDISREVTPRVQPPAAKADVLVTGGTGFIGRALVRRLASAGLKVRVFTHRELGVEEAARLGPKVEIVMGEIANRIDVLKACEGIKTVYHLAAATKGNWFYHMDSTVSGTHNVLEACEACKVSRLVYISTISVLNASKYPDIGVITEDFLYEEEPEKRGFYSHAKLGAEVMVREWTERQKTVRTIIMRPGLVYGPEKQLIGDVGKRIGKKFLMVFGSGSRLLPLVYVENLVDALVAAGESDLEGVYNVIDTEEITAEELIRKFRGITGERIHALFLPFLFLQIAFWPLEQILGLMTGKKPAIVYKLKSVTASAKHSSERLQRALGWNSRVPLFEALTETFRGNKDLVSR